MKVIRGKDLPVKVEAGETVLLVFESERQKMTRDQRAAEIGRMFGYGNPTTTKLLHLLEDAYSDGYTHGAADEYTKHAQLPLVTKPLFERCPYGGQSVSACMLEKGHAGYHERFFDNGYGIKRCDGNHAGPKCGPDCWNQ